MAWMQIPALHSLGPLGPVTETPEPWMRPSEVVRSPLGPVWTVLRAGLGFDPISLGIPELRGLELDVWEPHTLHRKPNRAKL